MTFNKTLLCVAIATVLSGCGGSDDDSSTPNSRAPEKNSLVCVDVNENAQCDADEASEAVVTWTDSAIATTLNATSPLAYEGDDGYVFTAPAGSTEISPESTLFASELIYNQVIATKTLTDVDSYLQGKLGAEILSSAHEQGFLVALKAAFESNPSADRYSVIAAVVDKVITAGADNLASIKDITVSASDIEAAATPSLAKLELTELLSKNVDDVIAEQDSNGWIDSHDASISVLSAKNGKVIGGSHYHNALTVLDVATGEVTYTPVSVVSDGGHHTDSSTGASEGYLRDVTFNADASYAYVNIPPKRLTSTSNNEDTFGLYKVKIEADGSIATNVNGFVHSIDEAESVRLAKKLNAFSVSNDDSTVVTQDGDDFFTVYDTDLANPGTSALIKGVETFANTASAVFTVTENAADDSKGDINELAVGTLTGSTVLTLDFVPQELRISNDGSKLLAFNHGHDNDGAMTIALIDLTSNSVVGSNTFSTTSDTAAVSEDFSKLAIVGHEDSRLLIVNLAVPGFSIQALRELDYSPRDAAFISNSQLAVLDGDNSIGVLDISTTSDNISLEEKTTLALAGLNRASINGGGYLDAVISDLSLSGKYENVGITWSADSSLDGNLTLPAGTVVRPTAGETDATGVLTAMTSVSFRGDTLSSDKAFDISIRKVPNALSSQDVVSIQTSENSSQYMAANNSGDLMVAPVRFENADGERVYGFVGVSVSGGVASISTGSAEASKTYSDTESLIGVAIYEGDTASFALGVSEALGDTGQPRIFSVAIGADDAFADTVTSSIDITGVPLRVMSTTDGSLITVTVEKEDESFVTEVYAIDDAGVLTLNSTIEMAATDYKSYGPQAINSDASRVYQRDGDKVVMNDVDGTTLSSADVEEIARVWLYNDRVIVTTYDGNIISFNTELEESSRQVFSTGTGGRIYGGVGRLVGGTHYFYIPVQRAADELNGIYQLEMMADGSLKEVAFSPNANGADRMAVSGDGSTVFFSYEDDEDRRWFDIVTVD